MRVVLATVVLACASSVASGGALVEPDDPAPAEPPVIPSERDCDYTYGEITFGVGAAKYLSGDILEGGAIVLNRAAFGRAVRFGCDGGLETRLGLFADLASGDYAESVFLGFGLEGELNTPITKNKRLGVRLSLEHHGFAHEATSKGSTVIPTVGARLRIADSYALGLDAFYLRYHSDLWGRSTSVGAMATLGVQGLRATAINMIVIGLGLGYAIVLATAP